MTIQQHTSEFPSGKSAEAERDALAAYLNVLYGNHVGPLPFDLDGEPLDIQRIEDIHPSARALPSNADSLFFCVGVIDEAERDDYATCANEPSMAMFNAEKKLMLLIYALNEPEQDGATVDRLLDIFEMDPNEGLPLPGQDGWDVVHTGEQVYGAQELLQRLSGVAEGISIADGIEIPDEDETALEPAVDESRKFYDAVIRTPFTPEGYANKTITVSLGDNSKSLQWTPVEIPLLDLLMLLSRHQIGKKDGKSFVFANMVEGQRLKNAVKGVTAIALDVDNGIPTEQIDAALKKLNCLAVRYTTHSHFKTESEFKRDEILRFEPEAQEITTEVIRRYLLRKKHWYEPLVETAEYLDEVHESSGIMIKVKHAPMHKNRIVVPLRDPFVIAQEGKTQMEAMAKWAKYPRALSDLLKIPYDPACTDPSRVFFPPRHDKSRPFSASIFGGPLFDKTALQLGNSFDALAEIAKKMGGKSHTEEGKALGKWSSRFAHGCQIVDIIQEYAPGKIRGPASLGSNIECPFDAGHHNPGDEGDRACWTVNAAQGGNELPIVSCRHGTCENYTFLDMIGKMVKDEWFPREALEDLTFNILKFDSPEEKAKAEKSTKREQARSLYLAAIDALPEKPSDDELEDVVAKVIAADLSPNELDNAQDRIAKTIKKTKVVAKATFKKVSKTQSTAGGAEQSDTQSETNSSETSDGYGGALVFSNNKGPYPKHVTYDKETKAIYPSLRNALLLIGHEGWDLGYNELTQNYGMSGDVVYPWPEHLGYTLNDAIRREIRLYLLRRWGVTFSIENIYEATMTLARRNTFNPVVDYMAEVEPQFDGKPRVDRWLETYMGVKVAPDCNHPEGTNEPCEKCDHRNYVRAAGKIVLVAAVRRAREPGCKFDEMMILEGPQGGGKSTALRKMGGDHFSDANLGNLTKKEAPMKLRGVWIQENAELAGLRKAEVDELKEFLSQRSDRYKIPYAKTEEDFPRRCIIIGTANPGGGAYLTDLTGNRRFWPVLCGKIDLVGLECDRDQLWAEAAMMESRGDSIRLDPSLYGAAKTEQDARLADEPWIELLAIYLDNKYDRGERRVLSTTLLTEALQVPPERQGQATTKKLKAAMACIPTWEYRTSMRADGVRSAGYEYVGLQPASPPVAQA